MKQNKLNTGGWEITYKGKRATGATLEEAQAEMLKQLGGEC